MAHFIPATEEHVDLLLKNLRPADRAELEALLGDEKLWKPAILAMLGPYHHLPQEAFAMYADSGEFAGMCGVFRYNTPDAFKPQVWMLGTPVLEKHQTEFLRAGRKWVREMADRHGHISNHVDARNTKAIQWLRWLGFKFNGSIHCWGVARLPFLYFSMIGHKKEECA
ncbi:hypothetical protein V5F38_19115 [Xanthobacter sp. V0B-10]|uniref:hypothetical protein n=1 Tax=Xanthobacter albus TaxID=3119929 RepID=UPI0037277132